MTIYGKAHSFTGTRFHSVIFALLMKIPALVIFYFGPKSTGIMKMLGLEEFVFDLEKITFEQAVKKFNGLLQDRERLAAEIKKSVSRLSQSSEKTASLIVKATHERRT